MQVSLQGKNAVVTGATGGMGVAICKALAKEGCNLYLMSKTLEKLQKLALEIRQEFKTVTVAYNVTDMSDRGSIDQTVEAITKHQEFQQVHILVNTAGIGQFESIFKADWKVWQDVMNINLNNLMYLTYKLLPLIKKNGIDHGAIINIASVAGLSTGGQSGAYSSSKAGVIAFTKALFEDIRNEELNIKVCSISPGYVDTPMLDDKPELDRSKMITVEEVAHTVMFVAKFPTRSCPTEIVLKPQKIVQSKK